MSKVDDELTRRLRRAERPVDGDGVFEGLERRRSHRERVRRVQAGMLAFAVLASTAGGFAILSNAFDDDGRGVGESPSPVTLASNGEIVFSAEGTDGYSHLYAMQSDGSERRQITDFGTNDTDPAVSADGRTIAFVHRLEDVTPAIATIPMKGGTVTWQTPDGLAASDPVWSPDGARIAFVGQTSGWSVLYVMRLNGVPTPLTSRLDVHAAGPTWSPDGTRIAFALRGSSGPWGLASIRPDGTGLEPLRTPEGDEEAPAWSPDGSHIAFLRTRNEGQEIWTIDSEGGSPQLVARALEASLQADLNWAPDGSALLVSDGEWIFQVDPAGDPDGNFVQLVKGTSPAWQPVPAGTVPEPSPTSEPTMSPSAEPNGRDIGLGFNLCHLQRLGGIDFLGDGTSGTAWTGNKTVSDGACPGIEDDRYGVAVDFTGDGIADSWSGETIEHCTGCEPFKAVDLNGDGAEDLIVTVSYFSIMQYGLYTVTPVDGELQVVPFRTGEPGHAKHALDAGKPFTFWVGGDAGSADWFFCDRLPEFWLTGTESPIDGGAGDVTTWHETQVSLTTNATADILYARTYTVPYGTVIDHEHTTSKPDCGLGVDIQR